MQVEGGGPRKHTKWKVFIEGEWDKKVNNKRKELF